MIQGNDAINKKLEELEQSFFEFMDEGSNVKKWHINQAMKSIKRCLIRMENCRTQKHAFRNIARTVVTLNLLNLLTKHDLIFTTEREDIADILNEAAKIKSLNPNAEDLTEDFRTW